MKNIKIIMFITSVILSLISLQTVALPTPGTAGGAVGEGAVGGLSGFAIPLGMIAGLGAASLASGAIGGNNPNSNTGTTR